MCLSHVMPSAVNSQWVGNPCCQQAANEVEASLTLREEYRLRVFENRILRRIFGPKMNEHG